MATNEKIPDWRIAGDWFDLCSCYVGCPCVFGSLPSTGICEGVLTWVIREGQFGDVPLGGLNAVLVGHFEGSVLEKNRNFGFLLDERANPAQRSALETIFTGAAGGCFAAWRDLTVRTFGVQFVPIHVSVEEDSWRIEVPGMIDGEGGPIRGLMVGPGKVCKITNAPRPEVTPGDITVGQARRNILNAFGFKWDWANYSAKHIPFDLTGPKAFSWRKPLSQQ